MSDQPIKQKWTDYLPLPLPVFILVTVAAVAWVNYGMRPFYAWLFATLRAFGFG